MRNCWMQEEGEIKSKPSLLGFVAVKRSKQTKKTNKQNQKTKTNQRKRLKKPKPFSRECTLMAFKIKKLEENPPWT